MKKAVISKRFMEKNNGSVRHVISQGVCLSKLGYEVTILSEKASANLISQIPADWVKLYGWPLRGYMRQRFYDYQVQRWLRTHKHDLFISNSEACSNDILVFHNCVNLAHERIENSPLPAGNNLGRVHSRVFRKSNYRLLIAVSEMMKRDLVDRYQLDPDTAVVLYPGVDLSVFNRNDAVSKRITGRKLAGISNDAICIGLITSGDFKVRNVKFFLKFAAGLSGATQYKINFLVVGENKQNLSEYEQLTSKLGIADHVTFLPFTEDVMSLYHALDLFVHPAYMDTFGYVVLESIASGIPCLISDNVGASELMVKHGLPYVLSGYNENEWVDSALAILNDSKLANRLQDEGVKLAQRFSLDNQILALENLFQQLR
jgi:UDP-glucose:(heptosyl)LPS alpha-1,3-glucosyltransferase